MTYIGVKGTGFVQPQALSSPDRLAQEVVHNVFVGLSTRRLSGFKVDRVPGNRMEFQPIKG